MTDFKQLQVTDIAKSLTLDVYSSTRRFPDDERFGLTSQLRRASVSIGANVAESCGRSSQRERARFVDMASGSAHEVEYLLGLSLALGFLTEADWHVLHAQATRVQRMLSGLRSAMRKNVP